MKNFEHIDATSVDEAIESLSKFKGTAKIISGGTDLLGELKDRVLVTYPEALVNIKGISELDYIKKDESGLKIGSLAKLADIADSPVVREECGVLAEAVKSVATPQIRNMATIGGNLAQDIRCWYYRYPHHMGGRIMCMRKGSGPCLAITGDNRYHAVIEPQKCVGVCPSDTAVALSVLDAEIRIEGPDGHRLVPVSQFYKPLEYDLKVDEIITEIQIPRLPNGAQKTFLKFRLREAVDFAIVSLALIINIDDGICRNSRIALGAVASGPFRVVQAERVLNGSALDSRTIEAAAEAAVDGAVPLSGNAYKIEIIKALVRRALTS